VGRLLQSFLMPCPTCAGQRWICEVPPDKQEKATQTVLEQAALLTDLWTAA
jgi:hypothetical protein